MVGECYLYHIHLSSPDESVRRVFLKLFNSDGRELPQRLNSLDFLLLRAFLLSSRKPLNSFTA